MVTTRLSRTALFFSDQDTILGDVIEMCDEFSSIKFVHVKRDENIVVHNLARVVPFGVEYCWENHCPRDVAPYVLMDTFLNEIDNIIYINRHLIHTKIGIFSFNLVTHFLKNIEAISVTSWPCNSD